MLNLIHCETTHHKGIHIILNYIYAEHYGSKLFAFIDWFMFKIFKEKKIPKSLCRSVRNKKLLSNIPYHFKITKCLSNNEKKKQFVFN